MTATFLSSDPRVTLELVNEFIAYCYADDMKSDKFINLPPNEQEAVLEKARQRTAWQLESLYEAFDAKDAFTLRRKLDRINPFYRKSFTKLTGISLGKTVAECDEALRKFIPNFDEQIEAHRQKREADAQARAAKQVQDDRDRALSVQYRWASLGGGVAKPTKVRDIIDELIAAGYRPVRGKRGSFEVVHLMNAASNRQTTFRKKHEIEYAFEAAAERDATQGELDCLAQDAAATHA